MALQPGGMPPLCACVARAARDMRSHSGGRRKGCSVGGSGTAAVADASPCYVWMDGHPWVDTMP
eukprot:364506-Chlamydomonas_euryale.AAC.1